MNVISFPKLNIVLSIKTAAFHIGAKPIYWYAVIILTGFLLGMFFVARNSKTYGVDSENVMDIALFGLVFGIIGARIYYVCFALDEFTSIADIFKIWNGGLAIYGGIIAAFISTAVYCRIKKLNMLNVFDVCCPGLFIGQAIGRWGNFVNAEVFGRETALPWGMSVNGSVPVHPLFLYESLWNVLGLIILCMFRNKKTADGQVVCFYVGWYSLGRLFLEGMRDPAYILYAVPGVLGISQIVALCGVIGSVVMFTVLTKRSKQNIN